jgi:hypothetical protein
MQVEATARGARGLVAVHGAVLVIAVGADREAGHGEHADRAASHIAVDENQHAGHAAAMPRKRFPGAFLSLWNGSYPEKNAMKKLFAIVALANVAALTANPVFAAVKHRAERPTAVERPNRSNVYQSDASGNFM